MPFSIEPESGLSYRLDLLEGSIMGPASPSRRAQTLPVSVVSYGYFVAGPGHFTERDQMRCLFQVFITHSGRGRFLIDGEELIAEPGTVALLDCGHPHRYESLDGVWEHEWVNFSGSGCRIYYELINPEGFAIYPLDGNDDIPAVMREIREGVGRQDMPGFVHTSTRIIRLLDAIYGLTVEQQRMRMTDRQSNVVRSVKYIDAHYMEPLSLENLAQTAFLSKFYYTRAFKRYMGVTPYEYLNTVRINHAKSLLLATRISVEDSAWRVGFSGSKNLIRQFKQATGMTPGEYRRSAGG